MTMRKRGTGSIEESTGGRWRARLVTETGRKSLGAFPTKEEADAVLEAARYELGELSRSQGLTLEAWGKMFLKARERAGFRSVADGRRRWTLHVVGSELAPLPLRSIRPQDVRAWVDVLTAKRAKDRRQRRKLSRRTLENILNLLRAAFAAAKDRGLVESNPAEGVTIPNRVSPTHEPWTYLLLEEQMAIFACLVIPAHHRLIIAVAIGTGLREGELFNLLLVDVHITGPTPHIVVRYGSKDGGPKNVRGEKPKIRRVPLFGIGLEGMRGWLNLLPLFCPKNPLGLVFPGPTGARRQMGKHLHVTRRNAEKKKPRPHNPLPEYLAAAGIVISKRHDGMPVRFQDFRHTFASSLVSGAWGPAWSLEQIQVVMGHESITTTQRYAHLAESAIWRQAALMMAPARDPAERPRPAPVQTPLRAQSREMIAEPPSRFELETYGLRTASTHERSREFVRLSARERALEALEQLGRGDDGLIRSILADLALTDADARAALAEVMEGRWGHAVELVAALAKAHRDAEQILKTGWQ